MLAPNGERKDEVVGDKPCSDPFEGLVIRDFLLLRSTVKKIFWDESRQTDTYDKLCGGTVRWAESRVGRGTYAD